MRKVILSMYVTLDGFVEGPNGEFDWFMGEYDREMARLIEEQLNEMDILILGRASYEALSRQYGSASGTAADRINKMEKLVFADTLTSVSWQNTRLATSQIAEEICELKQRAGKHLFLNGGQRILSHFMELGLIDEYRIWVHPVVIGEGVQLFHDLHRKFELQLMYARTFDSGVILLNYRPQLAHSGCRKN